LVGWASTDQKQRILKFLGIMDNPGREKRSDRKDQIVKNNQAVFDELNALMAKGIKLTYEPGNHDMTLEGDILDRALPGINQARDVNGLGKCVTGIRDEIVIEHGHRYDVFSAPDSVSNKEITGDAPSILPPGYFYARIAASEEASRC
jgi:UDP-2,3-diacylglucosamine pyrophosphatase LpxH